nr:reverse transcriptase domain-containing protein [Tanacetum cinerariifolium]
MFRKKFKDPRGVTTLRIQNTKCTSREKGEEGAEEYSIGWEVKEGVRPHTRKAVTRVPARKERNLFPKNVTMQELVHGGQRNAIRKRGDFRNHQRSERRRDKFTLLTKSYFALDKGKFKAPPPMKTPVEKRNSNKFCEFHEEVRHNTDECMHLKRQTKELIKAGKLSDVIKELNQGSRKDKPKAAKREKGRGRNERSHDHLGRDRRSLHTSHICGWRIGFRNIRRTLLQQVPSRSKKPNGFGYPTPHWFLRIDHMANKTYIAAIKNRVCRVLNLYLDECFGGKITISVQCDHKKVRGEENSSSPVNSSWNDKIPSSRRNNHSTKQQDYPTRVHNGLQTKSKTLRHHSSGRRKDQSSNSSRISRANSCNRLYPNRGRMEGIMRIAQA